MNNVQWLSDLKVIDMTSNIAGPTAARMFAELGANVIKVEPPWGEDARNSTTQFLGREGSLHLAVNRNKRGIAIDLRNTQGQEVMFRLLRSADIFIENTAPGSLDRFNMDYESVKALNPRLIYVSITGWGQSGPHASHVGYGLAAAAYAGLVVERPGEAPEPRGGMADPAAALLASWAAQVALRRRDQTGEGAYVTTSLLQGAMFLSGMGFAMAEAERGIPTAGMPGGGALGGFGSFRTADDRWIYLNIWSNEQFKRIFALAGMPEVGESEDYDDRAKRREHAAEINELLAYWISGLPCDELFETLKRESLPAAPVNSDIFGLVDDPQVQANMIIRRVSHPTKGDIWQLGSTYEIDGSRTTAHAAPLLGQHTRELLAEHGYGEAEIDDLVGKGAVLQDN